MTNPFIDEYGTKCWGNAEGKLHREDGPAVERDDGSKSWYLNGKQFTEEEFNVRKSIQKPSRAY